MNKKTLFITGCESFIGKNLINLCKRKKISYFGIDINTKNTKFTKKIDLRNKNLENYIPKGAIIIHLAAISKNILCIENPHLAMEVNISGTLNLIRAAKKKNSEKFIFASSIWVYGEKNSFKKLKENDLIDANKINSIYTLSKITVERYLEITNLFKSTIVLRFGIVYGSKNEQSWSIIEQIYNLVKNNNKKKLQIRSKNTARCFVHINDLVEGILKSLKKNIKFTIINLCGDQLIKVIDVINTSKKALKIKNKIEIKESHPFKPSIKSTSNKKAKSFILWKPKINFKKYLLTKMINYI